MVPANAISRNRANPSTATSCGNRRRALRLNDAVMRRAQTVFPAKTALCLSDVTGYSTRACEYWLSGKVVIPSDALTALIQSEWGREFLSVVMADRTPKWWLLLKAFFKQIEFQAVQRKQERLFKEMLDEVASSRPFASVVGDEDFMAGQVVPPHPMASRRRK